MECPDRNYDIPLMYCTTIHLQGFIVLLFLSCAVGYHVKSKPCTRCNGYVNAAMQNATENWLMCLLKEKGKLGTLESYGMYEAWVVVL